MTIRAGAIRSSFRRWTALAGPGWRGRHGRALNDGVMTRSLPDPLDPYASPSDAESEPPADNLSSLLDRIGRAGAGDRVSIGDVRTTIGERSFGPLLTVAGLFAVSPLGVIPSLPTILAITMGLIAGQMLLGMHKIWLPDVLLRRSIDRKRLVMVIDKVQPLARKIDSVLKPRLTFLTHEPFTRLIALVIVCICLLIPFLELFPFMATGPAAAITAFGLSIFLRDGLLALGAFAITGGSAVLISSAAPQILQRILDVFGAIF